MLINHDQIVGIIQSYRLCWICGRFSGGKTSFAFELSQVYLNQGYRLLTNCKSIWSDDIEEVVLNKNNFMKSVVLLDEGGLYFKANKQIEHMCSYAGKMDNIFLLPSFWPPTPTAQVVTVQPIFNLKRIGLPLIIYKWRVNVKGFKDEGTFAWLLPQEIYGIYSRRDPGLDPKKIVDWTISQTQEYIKREGAGGGENGLFEVESDLSETGALEYLAASLDQASDAWQTVGQRNTRGRRR